MTDAATSGVDLRGGSLGRLNAYLAAIFAASLTLIETVHNWGDWSEPAFWIIDYFACFLLGSGAFLILVRRKEAGFGLLSAGWGFACAMFWMAFFQIRRDFAHMPDTYDPVVLYVCLALFVVTIIGLAISLALTFKGR